MALVTLHSDPPKKDYYQPVQVAQDRTGFQVNGAEALQFNLDFMANNPFFGKNIPRRPIPIDHLTGRSKERTSYKGGALQMDLNQPYKFGIRHQGEMPSMPANEILFGGYDTDQSINIANVPEDDQGLYYGVNMADSSFVIGRRNRIPENSVVIPVQYSQDIDSAGVEEGRFTTYNKGEAVDNYVPTREGKILITDRNYKNPKFLYSTNPQERAAQVEQYINTYGRATLVMVDNGRFQRRYTSTTGEPFTEKDYINYDSNTLRNPKGERRSPTLVMMSDFPRGIEASQWKGSQYKNVRKTGLIGECPEGQCAEFAENNLYMAMQPPMKQDVWKETVGIKGDAWEYRDNILAAGGEYRYNRNDKINRKVGGKYDFKPGDVVTMFYPGSNYQERADEEGSGTTHVGYIERVNNDGGFYVMHNIHVQEGLNRRGKPNYKGRAYRSYVPPGQMALSDKTGVKIHTVLRPDYKDEVPNMDIDDYQKRLLVEQKKKEEPRDKKPPGLLQRSVAGYKAFGSQLIKAIQR